MTRRFKRFSRSALLAGLPITVLLLLAWTGRSAASCLTPDGAEKVHYHAVVLAGRAVSVQELNDFFGYQSATIQVERVWKGDVPVLVTVFSQGGLSETPHFEEGKEYILFLDLPTNEEAAEFLLAPGTLNAGSCSGYDTTDAFIPKLLKALGPGRSVG
jgi:hypothetical protein